MAVEDYTAAIAALEAEKKPLFEPYCNRGNCFRLLGAIDESINDLELASAMNLTNAACRVSTSAVPCCELGIGFQLLAANFRIHLLY